MSLAIEGYKGYFIPIRLLNVTKEKPNITHFFYGSSCCNSEVTKEFKCQKCSKDCLTVKVYPNGEKEFTGSRDLWDLQEIDLKQAQLENILIESWKYIEQTEMRKPLAREVEKMKQYFEDIKKLKSGNQLETLFTDLMNNRKALKGKIVLNSKLNSIYIMPFLTMDLKGTLIAGITDGNKELTEPKNKFEIPNLVSVDLKKSITKEN